MKVIYIAGKYRDERGEFFVRENIRMAERAAQFVWQHGGVALCPHKNTAGFGGLPMCNDGTWLKGDQEMMTRCDAVWFIDGWKESNGARDEFTFAWERIPILFELEEVPEFIRGDYRGMVKG